MNEAILSCRRHFHVRAILYGAGLIADIDSKV